MTTTGWRCVTCGTEVAVEATMVWRCPAATAHDPHHVLVPQRADGPCVPVEHPDPFVAFDAELAWSACAEALGMSQPDRVALIAELGLEFRRTPCRRHDELSSRLGFSDHGGVWVKDETGQVGGSHKARHLMTILLHLLMCEHVGAAPWRPDDRPRLAIASCGNAAIAAATLAATARWPLDVMVPPSAGAGVVNLISGLGATVHVCPRRRGDPPGDPCIHRFREAVANGSLPFSVQGTENAWCLDGGRTLGWELPEGFDHLFIQVGGGAFAASVGAAVLGSQPHPPKLHAVQTEGCAPLARAWHLAQALPGGVDEAAGHWAECMWPWDAPAASLADGILDDETYDWVQIVRIMAATGGSPVVAPEHLVRAAHHLVTHDLGLGVSPTGSSGLAGLMAVRQHIDDDARVAIVHSGVLRDHG